MFTSMGGNVFQILRKKEEGDKEKNFKTTTQIRRLICLQNGRQKITLEGIKPFIIYCFH